MILPFEEQYKEALEMAGSEILRTVMEAMAAPEGGIGLDQVTALIDGHVRHVWDARIAALAEKMATAADHERLAVAAALEKVAIKNCWRCNSVEWKEVAADGTHESIYAKVTVHEWCDSRLIWKAIPTADAAALDRMVNEARLEEAEWWRPRAVATFYVDNETVEDNRLAELRRAVGKGEAEC
jgi:hypothetical protein